MQDSAPVRGLQRAQDLEAKPHRFLRCQRTLRRRALDVLEHEITRANVVDLANVRMVQAGDRACFSLEPALPVGFRRQPRGQDLESDDAIEASVACTIDFAHPAGAKRRENFVGTEAGAGLQFHNGAWIYPSDLQTLLCASRSDGVALGRRAGTEARRGRESNAKEEIARGDVEALRVRVAKADVGRAHLPFRLAGQIGQLDRPQPLALGGRDPTSPGPAPVVEYRFPFRSTFMPSLLATSRNSRRLLTVSSGCTS